MPFSFYPLEFYKGTKPLIADDACLMFPHPAATLIRCDCGHAAGEHSDSGCGLRKCRCAKTPSMIVVDEIAALRPEWLRKKAPPPA